jgi:transposase-like protein
MAHTTIMRWFTIMLQFEHRWNGFARPAGSSWRVDETYVGPENRVAFEAPQTPTVAAPS